MSGNTRSDHPGTPLLIVTVTAVFDLAGPQPATPETLADALLADARVSTVHVGAHGEPSRVRVDIGTSDDAHAVAEATRAVAGVAAVLGLRMIVTSATVVRDGDRAEVPPAQT